MRHLIKRSYTYFEWRPIIPGKILLKGCLRSHKLWSSLKRLSKTVYLVQESNMASMTWHLCFLCQKVTHESFKYPANSNNFNEISEIYTRAINLLQHFHAADKLAKNFQPTIISFLLTLPDPGKTFHEKEQNGTVCVKALLRRQSRYQWELVRENVRNRPCLHQLRRKYLKICSKLFYPWMPFRNDRGRTIEEGDVNGTWWTIQMVHIAHERYGAPYETLFGWFDSLRGKVS